MTSARYWEPDEAASASMLGNCHAIWIERDVPGNSCDGWVRYLVGPYCVGAAVSEWFQIEVVGVALKRR